VPPAAGPDVMAAAPRGSRAFLDWGGGLVMIEAPAEGDGGAAAVRGAVAACGGHALLLRAAMDIRAAVPTFHPVAPGVEALSLRLRKAFDPETILNPHRLAREPA